MEMDVEPTNETNDVNNDAKLEPRTGKHRKAWLLGATAIAILAIGGYAYVGNLPGDKPVAAAAPAAVAVPVSTANVAARDIPISDSGLGTVTSLHQVDVKVRVDGQLQKIGFTEGEDIKAGDLLGQIDPRPYEAQLAQAQAALNKDQSQLDYLQKEEARASHLSSVGAGTTQASDSAKSQVAIYQATVQGDQAAVDTARLNLEFATVKAPIDGRTGFRQAEPGSIVRTTDSTGIVTVTQMRPIAVEFTLTQDQLPDLISGQKSATLPVAVDSRDGSKHLGDGKLSVIDSQVDSTTGMVKLKAVFPNDNLALWPGELVTARILLRTDHNAVSVPSAAILNGQTGPYVFVVKPDKTVASVSVKTGAVANGMTTVSGVNVGDTVAISGQSRLADGTLVNATPAADPKIASNDTGAAL